MLLASLWVGAAHAADPREPERDEDWWRAAMTSRERELEARTEELAECEAREAPPAYDAVEGYVARSRGDANPRFVEIKRCDEERDALEAARAEIDRFEEEARRHGVPPGWLRE